MTTMFNTYQHVISDKNVTFDGKTLPESLVINDRGRYKTYYAPFDYINMDARLVICGITPGMQQATNALNKVAQIMSMDSEVETTELLKHAKEYASFSGSMRRNLIDMLDFIGLAKWLELDSCARLFDTHAHLVHYTSALRYPVFLDGANYSGSPSMLSQPDLIAQIDAYLVHELSQLSGCVFLPLGPKVGEVFDNLAQRGVVNASQVLSGLPHPSGANAERIKYFLGQKERAALSNKVNPLSIEMARESLINKIKSL